MNGKKIIVHYYSYMTIYGNGQKERIYLFYPNNGDWDNHKRTLEEAQKAYPKDKYIWVKIKDDE